MTHTPGPWSYAMDDNYARIYLHGLGRMDDVKGGYSLCGWCGEANACLVAAAPDMKLALEHVRDGKTDMDEIIAAIAKAEGRTA